MFNPPINNRCIGWNKVIFNNDTVTIQITEFSHFSRNFTVNNDNRIFNRCSYIDAFINNAIPNV